MTDRRRKPVSARKRTTLNKEGAVRKPRSLRFMLAGAALAGGAPAQAATSAAYTLMAPDGGIVVRAISDNAACPVARIDGHVTTMDLRSAPRLFPPRPSASGSALAMPSNFPISICEIRLPRATRSVTISGQALPVPRRELRRIVVIGDTGCRLKASASAWQSCNDPAAWPFAAIAQAAASAHPDLVLHVGDYHYRENACPEGHAGCAGSPWAYGWDAWKADFVMPAAPLLAAAPWVVVRGNHEECARAGQGWWLLLDPHALTSEADCSDPARDFAGNHTDPYAVELGGHTRLIVADFAAIGEGHLTDPAKLARYRADAAAIGQLARAGDVNFVTDHYPFGAVTRDDKGALRTGYPAIADAFALSDGGSGGVPALPHVAAVLSGHVHLLQLADLHDHPLQVVTGFSGTQEDEPNAPTSLAELGPATGDVVANTLSGGVRLDALATRFGRFGFALLERQRDGSWRLTARDAAGNVLLRQIIRQR